MITAAILLAAGQSTRFGKNNKLLTKIKGENMVSYAAKALRGLPDRQLIAVISDDEVAALLPDFDLARIAAGQPQSASLAAGLALAAQKGADRALVILGDMPGVTTELCAQILDLAGGGVAAASDGIRTCPPACFPRHLFAEIQSLEGDQGARQILRGLDDTQRLVVAPHILMDIDRTTDLADWQAQQNNIPPS